MTVAIPTYNRVGDLRIAVESVLGQDYPRLDVVIADNASDDGTQDYCVELSSRDPRVRYLRGSVNDGPTANFNRGWEAATGEYFMWLGDDDWIDQGYLASAIDALERSAELVLVAGPVRYYHAGEFRYRGVAVQVDAPTPASRVRSYFRQVRDNGTFYGVIRSSALESIPVTANELGGDWLLIASLAARGAVLTLEDGPAVHRALGGSTSSLRNVAVTLGASRFAAEFPQLAIAGLVFREIGWRSPVYGASGRAGRLILGLECAAIIFARFVVPAVPKYFRLKARALGRRLKRSGAPDEDLDVPLGGSA